MLKNLLHKKEKKIFTILLCFIFISVIVYLIPFSFIYEIFSPYSPDGIIKDSTVQKFESIYSSTKIKLIAVSIGLLLLYIISPKINIIKFTVGFVDSIKNIYKKIDIHPYASISIFSLISVMLILAAIYFDVGQDEAFYLNDIQNIEKYGSMTREDGNFIFGINYNLLMVFISQILFNIIDFSILSCRLIIVFFSFLTLFIISYFFKGYVLKKTIISLVFFFPGIYTLTSTLHAEIIAIFL